MVYHLYVKTHNKTGLKYLGKTIKDPYKYKGSGKYWKPHIKKHGYDVTTEILGMYNSKTVLEEMGLYYSKKWNIVESDAWANLKEEAGDGGSNGPFTKKTKEKMRAAKLHKKQTSEHIENNRQARIGKVIVWNKGLTKETDVRVKQHGIITGQGKLGRKHPPETIERMRQAALTRWNKQLNAA